MNGDFENFDKGNNVTSIKNAWVICKSKSHPGHNYYFNYLTRESKWELSETEKEKVQNKVLSDAELDRCMEPNIPPEGIFPKTRFLNKQAISQLPSKPAEMYNIQGIPGSSGLDPNIWANPTNLPNGPYIIVPSALLPNIAPFINQSGANYGIQQTNEHSQNTNRNIPTSTNRNVPSNTFYQRGFKYNTGRGGFKKQYMKYNHAKRQDLRQRLSWRNHDLDIWNKQDNNTSNEDTLIEHKTRSWNTALQESPSKYDLSKVKQLGSLDPKSGFWLVVVDIDVLVTEFPFLNRLTDPDQHCYLMVPYHVFGELHERAATEQDRNIKRIDRFLSEQIRSDLAYRGKDVSTRAEDDCEKTYVTCLDWADENNIILLSNNTKYNKYKNNKHNIHVLTTNELKHILHFGSPKQSKASENPHSLREIKITVPNNTGHENIKDASPVKPILFTKSDVTRTIVNSQSHLCEPVEDRMKDVTISAMRNTVDTIDGDHEINYTADQGIEYECTHDTSPHKDTTTKELRLNRNISNYNNDNKPKKTLKRWHRRPLFSKITITNSMNDDFDAAQDSTVEENTRLHKNVKQKDNVETAYNASKTSKILELRNDLSNDSKSTTPVDHNMDTASKASKTSKMSATLNVHAVYNKCKNSHSKSPIETASNVSKSSKSSAMARNLVNTETNVSEEQGKDTKAKGHSPVRGNVSSPKKNPVNFIENSPSPVVRKSYSSHKAPNKEKMLKITTAVMYEVESPNMEEMLRTGRDEWVTRFVQIMEEILGQKLSDRSALNLRDAVTCIIGKYNKYFSVVDAANRLAFTLYQITDDKGNIKSDIEPCEFMEMYSYGVYLVEKLKDVTENCEDLNAADLSLKKLLFDINNSNSDSNHEVFTEEQNDNEVNLSESACIGIVHEETQCNTKQTNAISDYIIATNEENCDQSRSTHDSNRPHFISTNEWVNESELTHRSTESEQLDNSDGGLDKNMQSYLFSPNSHQSLPTFRHGLVNTPSVEKDSTVNDNDKSAVVEPVIARQFINLPQFEDKLKRKCNSKDVKEETCQKQHMECKTICREPEVDDSILKADDGNEDIQDGLSEGEIQDETEVNDAMFKKFIEEFVGEIRKKFLKVLVLQYELMSAVRERSGSIQATIEKAEMAAPLLFNISNSLERILYREGNDENLRHILKTAKMDNYVPSEQIVVEYTEIISEFKGQADHLYKYLTQMIEIYRSV